MKKELLPITNRQIDDWKPKNERGGRNGEKERQMKTKDGEEEERKKQKSKFKLLLQRENKLKDS